MAAIFLTKKVITIVSNSNSSRFRRACFSTAYERAEGSNAEAETEGVGDRGPSTPPDIANDPVSEGLYEAKQIDLDMTTDNVKDGAVKAAEMADKAKQTLDGTRVARRTKTVTGKEHEAEGPNIDISPDGG